MLVPIFIVLHDNHFFHNDFLSCNHINRLGQGKGPDHPGRNNQYTNDYSENHGARGVFFSRDGIGQGLEKGDKMIANRLELSGRPAAPSRLPPSLGVAR
jgi:hypothetical protein